MSGLRYSIAELAKRAEGRPKDGWYVRYLAVRAGRYWEKDLECKHVGHRSFDIGSGALLIESDSLIGFTDAAAK